MTAFSAADLPDSRITTAGTWNVSHRGGFVLLGGTAEQPGGESHWLRIRCFADLTDPGSNKVFNLRIRLLDATLTAFAQGGQGPLLRCRTPFASGSVLRVEHTFEVLFPAGPSIVFFADFLALPVAPDFVTPVAIPGRTELIAFRHV